MQHRVNVSATTLVTYDNLCDFKVLCNKNYYLKLSNSSKKVHVLMKKTQVLILFMYIYIYEVMFSNIKMVINKM